ncbi:MAG TPA: hypothetical protein VFF70_02790 [Anaerolineae bacterium]|jgi:hypothetical protein|nr:hypothetical protein [Anaerolineae bacterium]
MSQSPDRAPAPPAAHKQTPRVPANFLYAKLVPIAIGVMTIVLLVILVVGIAGLLNTLK